MVNGELYSQKLAWFKQNEKPEAVAHQNRCRLDQLDGLA